MSVQRHPCLIWQVAGAFAGCLVVDGAIGACGESPSEVMRELRDFITREKWAGPPLLEAELFVQKVPVRAEYRTGKRIYPTTSAFPLRVPAVKAHLVSGLQICALPLLDVSFYYHEASELKDLVTHYVQEVLKGVRPEALFRQFPPEGLTLDEVVVTRRDERPAAVEPPHPVLDEIADPAGDRALRRHLSRAWERDREIADLVARLSVEKANVLLVGPPGVGKTTLLVDAVRQLERGGARRRHWITGAGRMISGMPYLGQWQARCEALVEELSAIDGVLCIENLLELVSAGSREPQGSVAAFLAPYLLRGELRMVAEATPQELDACRRMLPAITDTMQVLVVPELDRAASLLVLEKHCEALSSRLRVTAGSGVVQTTFDLFRRFQPYRAFPGAAGSFLRELFEKTGRNIERADVLYRFGQMSGLPMRLMRDDEPLLEDEVRRALRAEVVGQPRACDAAAQVVVRFKASLQDAERPLGVLLFCGPTGVGKTQLAKSLSRYLFGHGDDTGRLVRLDMSEYASADRLLSSSEGGPSDFIKRVREQPFVVVLLDEIEKAEPDVFDALLGLLDEGRLTDPWGRVTSFRSAIVIMTSNLGAARGAPLGFTQRPVGSYEASVASFFRPEFFNRLDAVVVFDPLDGDAMREIVELELSQLAQREGLVRAGVRLTWTPALATHLAAEGFDPRYGARPLQRLIEQRIAAPLARFLLAAPRPGPVLLDVDDDGGVRIHQE